jgi:hypothetical protein
MLVIKTYLLLAKSVSFSENPSVIAPSSRKREKIMDNDIQRHCG